MPSVETKRGAFYFADHRQDDLPPMVLIHGAAGSRLDWPLPLRKMGAVVPDLNGHGKSKGEGRESIREYADDMAALLDALGIERAFICGQSMGGAIALTMALEHPDRVRGLILIASGARLRVHPDILTQARRNPAAVADILFKWLWSGETDEATREKGKAAFMAQKPEVIARDYLACDAYDVRDRLGDVKAPTLVLCGTADVMAPPKYSAFLAAGIPDAALRLFEGAGHNLHLERPVEVAAAMTEWMKARRG
jgi:pimeloyl-ACP methyl ester carboxylesterase